MIDFKVAKASFFDRKAVTDALDRAARRVLSKFGAFVRTRARSSIRKRKGVSSPGSPPSSHTGLLKQFLFFSYDEGRQSVVIGPVRLAGAAGRDAPENLEYGGSESADGRVMYVANEVGRGAGGKFTSGGKTRVELKGRITYRARPYMGPAFEAEQPKLAGMFRDTVK